MGWSCKRGTLYKDLQYQPASGYGCVFEGAPFSVGRTTNFHSPTCSLVSWPGLASRGACEDGGTDLWVEDGK